MSKQKRKKISRHISRKIRKRCGFGCVICGLPLYKIDHIEEWSKVKKHDLKKMTLLCPKHHAEKTKGLLDRQQVIEANQSPYNLHSGNSAPYDLHFKGKEFLINAGGIDYVIVGSREGTKIRVLSIDQKEILGYHFEDNHALITLNLYDQENNEILKIIDNRLEYSMRA